MNNTKYYLRWEIDLKSIGFLSDVILYSWLIYVGSNCVNFVVAARKLRQFYFSSSDELRRVATNLDQYINQSWRGKLEFRWERKLEKNKEKMKVTWSLI